MGSKIDDNDVDEGQAVPKQTAVEFAKNINGQFFLTSAKENMGINKMFHTAAELCAEHKDLRNDIDVSSRARPSISPTQSKFTSLIL